MDLVANVVSLHVLLLKVGVDSHYEVVDSAATVFGG